MAEDKKNFTQEELDKAIAEALEKAKKESQAETDRRVNEALEKEKKKNEAAIEEAKKMAAMDEAQKKEYELQLKQQELDAKIKELNLEKSKTEASKLLSDSKLSLDLLDFVVAEDSTVMKANVEKLSKVFASAVDAEATARISSTNPKKGNDSPASVTHEQFTKMSLAEKQKLFDENPEAYEAAKQG